MTDSIFNTAIQTTETQTTSTTTTTPDPVSELVGEGKKYKTVEDALKSIPHAQGHIQKLENEMAELRKELENRLKAEEVLHKIEASQKPAATATDAVDPEAIKKIAAEIAESTYTEKQRQETIIANLNEVDRLIKAKFGDKAKEVVANKQQELGIDLKELAAKSPKAFLQLFEVKQQSIPAHSNSSVNTEGNLNQGAVEYGTYAYYQKMRKDNPTAYFSPKVQNEMHQMAAKLGRDKFFGTS